MLTSLVFIVRPTRSGTLPVTNGQHLHGVFFDKLLRELDPELATRLHAEAHKPFTLSNIQPLVTNLPSQGQTFSLHPSQTCWFRLTSLSFWFSQYLLNDFRSLLTARAGQPLLDNILQHTFEILEIYDQSNQHPWAAQLNYAALLEAGRQTYLRHRNSKGGSKLRLFYHSPTFIKAAKPGISNATTLIPAPRSIFAELGRRWAIFSGLPLDPAFNQWLEDRVLISAYELRTAQVWLKENQTCFQGWCEYTSFSSDTELNSLLHTLGFFSFFAGVGSKTTMGCGQIWLEDLKT